MTYVQIQASIMAYDIIQTIKKLVEANVKTGYYDGKRGKMKVYYEASEKSYLDNNALLVALTQFTDTFVDTERKSRSNCEQRAVHRNSLDAMFAKIAQWIKEPICKM